MFGDDDRAAEIAWKAWRDERRGTPALEARQRERLAALVAYARTRSPSYRRLYAGLPDDVRDVRLLPPVTKRDLMADFDGWVTDPAVTRAGVERFVSDPARVGQPFLGRYAVWTTSGTTGEPALLVHDRRSWVVMNVLSRLRGLRGYVGPREAATIVARGSRSAAVFVTGGHFGGVATVERQRQQGAWFAERIRAFSALAPLDELVEQLNGFQPSMLGGYPSALALLAGEQEAGRLRLRPVVMSCAGERLTPEARARIEAAFGAKVRDGYGASEVGAIALGCREGWQHVQSDWVVLEPVDADLEPVPPGEPSTTVLLTGLANRVQPIIRYDIGDAVTVSPEPCACGSPLPAMRVVGRTNDTVELEAPDGHVVRLLPLALGAVVEETPRVRRFQVVQTGPTSLDVRLEPAADAHLDEVWGAVTARLRAFLAAHGLPAVELRLDSEPPTPARSGKLRQVWRSDLAGAPADPAPTGHQRGGSSGMPAASATSR